MEAEEKGLKKRIEELGVGSDSIMEWLGAGENMKKLVQCLVESIHVYAGKEVEVRWKFSI